MKLVLLKILGVYIAVVLLITVFQRSLQYHPETSPPGPPSLYGVPEFTEIELRTADGLDLFAWYAEPRDENGPVVAYMHGNAGHVGFRNLRAREFLSRGFGMLLIEYRGFGGNPGRITEEGLHADGRAGIEWLQKQGVPVDRIVLYGESIGSGIATQLATEYDAGALILEAPLDSAVSVGRRIYPFLPVGLLMFDRFDNIERIDGIDMPLLVMHGTADQVVPYEFGKRLFDAAREPKTMITVEGGRHENHYEYTYVVKRIFAFLDQYDLLPPVAPHAENDDSIVTKDGNEDAKDE